MQKYESYTYIQDYTDTKFPGVHAVDTVMYMQIRLQMWDRLKQM